MNSQTIFETLNSQLQSEFCFMRAGIDLPEVDEVEEIALNHLYIGVKNVRSQDSADDVIESIMRTLNSIDSTVKAVNLKNEYLQSVDGIQIKFLNMSVMLVKL